MFKGLHMRFPPDVIHSRVLGFGILAATTSAGAGAAGSSDHATILKLGAGGAQASFAYDINENGAVTGTLRDGALAAAFRWSKTDGIDVLDRPELEVPARGTAIGETGVVIGSGPRTAADLIPTLFRWAAGQRELEVLGEPATLEGAIGRGLLADDSIVGLVLGPGGLTREQAFILDDEFQPLSSAPSGATASAGHDAAGWRIAEDHHVQGVRWSIGAQGIDEQYLEGPPWSQGEGVNDAGDVVGMALGPAGPTAYVWRSDEPVVEFLLDGPHATRSIAYDINAAGDVVGAAETVDGRRAFLWTPDDGFIDLNSLLSPEDAGDWTLTQARAINDAGAITGFGLFSADGKALPVFRGFLMTLPTVAACNAADIAEPFGILDGADVNAFINAFGTGGDAADIADPAGVIDGADVNAFINAFGAGCP